MAIIKIKFKGVDSWNRPVFKAADENIYYGNVDKLFSYGVNESEVLKEISVKDLTFFGNCFDCEPMGTEPVHDLEIIKREV